MPTLHTCRSCHSSLLNPVWSVLLLPLSAAPHNSSCLRCECPLPAPTPAVKQPCTLSLHVVKDAMLLHAKMTFTQPSQCKNLAKSVTGTPHAQHVMASPGANSNLHKNDPMGSCTLRCTSCHTVRARKELA
jgi:hypothetical protein